jgi:ubiquinone biosynthesis protein Coq4
MALESFRVRIVSWAIRDSIPVLNLVRRPKPWPSLEELRAYPEESLGRAIAELLDARGLPFLPKYETHDAIHVLLGYDTTARGELELQAFMWGNASSSIAGRVLFLWGGLMLPEHWRPMRAALLRGRRALLAGQRLRTFDGGDHVELLRRRRDVCGVRP